MGLSGRGRGRPADLVAVAGAVVGAAAAAQVIAPPRVLDVPPSLDDFTRRVVCRAKYDAFRAVLADLDDRDEGQTFTADDVRRMVNDAARRIGMGYVWWEDERP